MKAQELRGTTRRVYEFIVDFVKTHQYPPAVREINEALGIKSTSTAFYHLEKLSQMGLIKKEAAKNRVIELVNPTAQKTELVEIPVIGKVAAGIPILAVENIIDTITLPITLFKGSSIFFLKVQGDSMIDAGIYDGDYIAVNQQNDTENGEIVVAMIDDEATVKRLRKEKGRVMLYPENDNYEPIEVNENLTILGKVVGLFRTHI